MCGICGFTGSVLDNSILKQMCDVIAHRGPDGEGQYCDKGVSLGHRRLSLIDLEGGNQPMIRISQEPTARVTSPVTENKTEYTRGDYALVFNGEIYNYQDLQEELKNLGYTFTTNSDTEVLLTAYLVWDKALLDHVRGMFAFALWDAKKEELFCARDFFGIKPFYYTQHEGRFIFGSEIKSILEFPGIPRIMNKEALEQYLSFQYSVLPETFFKGIFKLMPGHYLTVKPGEEPVITQYWQVDYDLDDSMPFDQAVNRIHAAVQDSVKYHRVADVEVASFLSSGVDSNYLSASLHDQGTNIKTFTVGFETPEGTKYNEISYAKEASEYLGVENFSHVISEEEFWTSLEKVQWHMDEPSADPAAVALYFVDREASKKVKAVLSGEGSDEFFGGYTIYQTPLENKKLAWCPRPILKAGATILKAFGIRGANYLRRASTPIEQQFIGNAFMFTTEERKMLLKDSVTDESPQDLTAPSYTKVANLDDVTKMQYIDMNFWLVGDILLKTDKMSMAHSLESRVPFLDKEVWAVARTLPTKNRVTLETTKIALRKAAQNLLPERFSEKKKLGFPVPTRVWLKQDKYYNLVKVAFESSTAQKYFHHEKLIALLDAHREDKADNSRKIWTIYTFLVWHKVYFEA